jgi:hypothetical protein
MRIATALGLAKAVELLRLRSVELARSTIELRAQNESLEAYIVGKTKRC